MRMKTPGGISIPPYMLATEREQDNPRAQISRRILMSQAKFAYEDWTRDGFDTKILDGRASNSRSRQGVGSTREQRSLNGPPSSKSRSSCSRPGTASARSIRWR